MTSLEVKLLLAIAEGKVRKIASILDSNVDINFQDEHGRTPLISAVVCDFDDIRTHVVRLILRQGCDVNIQDGFGRTALIHACMDPDRMDIVRLIIRQKSCDPNIADVEGNTAVIHSVLASNSEALSAIISASVTKRILNLGIKNKSGMTALDLAIKLQKFECCKILAKDGGARSTNVTQGRGLEIILGRDSSSVSQHAFGQEDIVKRHRKTHHREDHKQHEQRSGTPVPHEVPVSSTPSCDKRNEYLRKFRQERPDLYFPPRQESVHGRHSKLSFTRDYSQLSIKSQKNVTNNSDNFSPRVQKRALTPISARRKIEPEVISETASESSLDSPFVSDAALFGNRMRLPSIPSGKRLCLISNQNGLEQSSTEV